MKDLESFENEGRNLMSRDDMTYAMVCVKLR